MKAMLATLLSRRVLPMCVAAGAVAAFLLGNLAAVSAVFDFSAQFTAHWLTIAVIAVVASFIPNHAYKLLAASILAAGLLPVALYHWYAVSGTGAAVPRALALADPAAAAPQNPTPAPRGQRHFKLLSYNIYNSNQDIQAVWAEVARHDADVVILIEFGPNKAALKPRLEKAYPYHRSCDDDWDCAIGLYSRLPVSEFHVTRPRDDAGPSIITAEIKLADTPVTIAGVHILSPNRGPRANFKELDHLAERARRRSTPMVVAGDLNTTIWAHAFDNFRRKSGLKHMGALIPTWPAQPLPLPQLGIDHVFTSQELRINEIASGDPSGSDHVPLIATIELR